MISVFGCSVGKEEKRAVDDCLDSQWLGFGSKVEEFEKAFSYVRNIENFAMVDNASNGLYMAVCMLNLPSNSKIIVPSFTWVACAHAIILAGHRPVFCDVDYDTMNVTAEAIHEVIDKDVRAIMVVHYAGLSVEMDDIKSFAIPVIEDAAHAVYTDYYGTSCGNIGDIGVFSFDSIKNLATPGGGGIACKNGELLERAKLMRYCGIGKSGFEAQQAGSNRWWEYNINEVFIKALPNNVSAAIGLEQLKKSNELQSRRKHIWNYYCECLDKVVNIPIDAKSHSYFTYAIRCKDRDGLAKHLLDSGIYVTLRYHPLHMNNVYHQTEVRLKNTEVLNNECLSLPIHPRMSDEEVERVVDKVMGFYGK